MTKTYTHQFRISSSGIFYKIVIQPHYQNVKDEYSRLYEPVPFVAEDEYYLSYNTKRKILSIAQEIELKTKLYAYKKWKEIPNPIDVKYIYTHILAIRRGKIRMFTFQSPVTNVGIEYTRLIVYPNKPLGIMTKDINLFFSKYHVRKPNFTIVKVTSWEKELDDAQLITMYRILYNNYIYLKETVWKE